MLSKIYNFLNYCYEDNLGKTIPTLELQLFLITVKCLLPYEDKIGCSLDVWRYEKEIELLQYYKNGYDECLESYYENKKPTLTEDNLLEYKIIPIVIANTVWDNLLEEVLKATMFFTINKKSILNAIIVSSVLYEYFLDHELDLNNSITKERIINFSLKDFLESNKIQTNKNSLIEFEKERIKILSKNYLITEELMKNYKSLGYIFNNTYDQEIQDKVESILTSFSTYLFKLRKGIINPEKLKIPHDNIPEFKEFLRYPAFTHPLLGKCKVLKRSRNEIVLKNKTGLMKVNI